jgi:hypothetical protein
MIETLKILPVPMTDEEGNHGKVKSKNKRN